MDQPSHAKDFRSKSREGLCRENEKTLTVSLDDFLEGLREGEVCDPGQFTIAPERAKALLAGKSLADVWSAWTCIAQGLVAQGAGAMEITITRRAVIWRADLRRNLIDLLRDERFLLGWLNLGWFGSPHWTSTDGTLSVEWRGNAWNRYRLSATMQSQLQQTLKYCPIPVKVGEARPVQTHLPAGCPLCLYPLPPGQPGGFEFVDADMARQGGSERRRFLLPGQSQDKETGRLAAFASKSRVSWSQVTWVHLGAVISEERNTLERPGVSVVASVEALELQTDLSGFSVVTNEAYFRFINQLKRDVLWML